MRTITYQHRIQGSNRHELITVLNHKAGRMTLDEKSADITTHGLHPWKDLIANSRHKSTAALDRGTARGGKL